MARDTALSNCKSHQALSTYQIFEDRETKLNQLSALDCGFGIYIGHGRATAMLYAHPLPYMRDLSSAFRHK